MIRSIDKGQRKTEQLPSRLSLPYWEVSQASAKMGGVLFFGRCYKGTFKTSVLLVCFQAQLEWCLMLIRLGSGQMAEADVLRLLSEAERHNDEEAWESLWEQSYVAKRVFPSYFSIKCGDDDPKVFLFVPKSWEEFFLMVPLWCAGLMACWTTEISRSNMNFKSSKCTHETQWIKFTLKWIEQCLRRVMGMARGRGSQALPVALGAGE